jgi:ankyrin repeat protein
MRRDARFVRGFDEVGIAQIIADAAEAWPDGVLYVNNNGRTLLHKAILASDSKTDVTLLRTILAIHPESIEMTDLQGASATHVALRRDDGDGSVVERLELLREGGGVQDSDGRTPLHQACYGVYPRDVIMILVANHPSALNIRDTHGMTPLDTFRRRHQYFLTKWNYTGRHWDERYNDFADIFMTLLVRAPVYCSDSPSLHELLHNQACTPDIAKLLIYALRDQASLKDGNGNLPLHIVASRYSDNDFMYGKAIETLLEVYPAACQISNIEGTLPLQLMDRSGKSWSNGMRMVLLRHPAAAVLDLELNRVAICALLAKVGSEEKPDALFRLLKDAPVFARRANVAHVAQSQKGDLQSSTCSIL